MTVLKFLKCPVCDSVNLSNKGSNLICHNCSSIFDFSNQVLNFLSPINNQNQYLKSSLEDINYDLLHNVSSKASEVSHRRFKQVCKNLGLEYNNILEIGCGTGLMTTELAKDTAIKNLVATDLSIKFLNTAKSRVSEASKNVYFVACDANNLPFLSEFDCVMGHSILHHILDYKSTLKASYKILPKGGFAAFFEPVIQAKIFILFLITLLENFDNLMEAGEITPEKKINLNHFKNNVLKGKKYAADSKFISSLEE